MTSEQFVETIGRDLGTDDLRWMNRESKDFFCKEGFLSRNHIEQIVQQLHSSRSGRRKAVEELRQLGEPGGQLSIEALIHMMLNDTLPLRQAAAQILREWREYVPIEPLFLAMQDTHAQVRSAARWTLAEVGEYASQESILSHLADPDPAVREAVLYALGTRAPIPLVLEAIGAPEEDLREAATYLISLLGEQIPVEPLLNMLKTGDAHIRVAVVRSLGNLGERIPIESLIEALHDTETNVRLNAIESLANLGEQMPRAELRALLDDADQSIRQEVTKALASGGDPASLATIVNLLHADHEWARENTLVWLQTSIDVERDGLARHLPLDELLHLLKDEWWPVGFMAARMIALLDEQAPFAELLALLSDPLPEARCAALHTLALLGESIPLSQYVPLEPVLAALETEDGETRRDAAEVLSYFGSRVPVDRLLPFVEDQNVEIARLIAKQGRQEGIDVLVANLCISDRVRTAAAALGELGKHAPAKPLLAALHTSDGSARQSVAAVLYETHPELLPPLVVELVETLGSGQVGPLLEPLRETLVAEALAALSSFHPALLAWFDHALDAPNWEVRMWAIYGLSKMAPHVLEPTIEKLQRLLDDPESASVRVAARRALEIFLPGTATDGFRE
jgi:HEAT repeat protein